jgi:hypothetical protein
MRMMMHRISAREVIRAKRYEVLIDRQRLTRFAES